MRIIYYKLQHAMAQAASQLHQIQKKQQNQLTGSSGGGGGILSRMMPTIKNQNDPFLLDRPQPTKAQLTMPPSLHLNKEWQCGTSDVDKPGLSLAGHLPPSSPLSLSPHGSIGGPPSLFGGLSHLSPPGCHMQVTNYQLRITLRIVSSEYNG